MVSIMTLSSESLFVSMPIPVYIGMKVLEGYINPNGMKRKKNHPQRLELYRYLKTVKTSCIVHTQVVLDNETPTLEFYLICE